MKFVRNLFNLLQLLQSGRAATAGCFDKTILLDKTIQTSSWTVIYDQTGHQEKLVWHLNCQGHP